MTIELRQTRLPGVGVKYSFNPAHGGRAAVIMHNDGMREIYFFRSRDDEDPAPSSRSTTRKHASSERCSAAPTIVRRSSRSSRWPSES